MIASGFFQALRRPILEPVLHLAVWLQPLAWLMAWLGYLSGHAHLANRLGFGKDVTRSQLEHTTRLATRNPPGVLAKGNLAIFQWDAETGVANIDCPILVIGAGIDIITRRRPAGGSPATPAPTRVCRSSTARTTWDSWSSWMPIPALWRPSLTSWTDLRRRERRLRDLRNGALRGPVSPGPQPERPDVHA